MEYDNFSVLCEVNIKLDTVADSDAALNAGIEFSGIVWLRLCSPLCAMFLPKRF